MEMGSGCPKIFSGDSRPMVGCQMAAVSCPGWLAKQRGKRVLGERKRGRERDGRMIERWWCEWRRRNQRPLAGAMMAGKQGGFMCEAEKAGRAEKFMGVSFFFGCLFYCLVIFDL